LAPVFWYLIPFIAVALLLAITLKQIPLSDTPGMVARGEAVGGEEADRLGAERLHRLRQNGADHPAPMGDANVPAPGGELESLEQDSEPVSRRP
jgi:hypothetical protein